MFSNQKEKKQIAALEDQIKSLKRECEELKTKKIMEEREIKHLVTLKEEKLNLEYEKKQVELLKKAQQTEMTLQTSYHDKILKHLDTARIEMKEVYTAIMERLPNVNVEVKRK